MLKEYEKKPLLDVEIYWIGNCEGNSQEFSVYINPIDKKNMISSGAAKRALVITKAIKNAFETRHYSGVDIDESDEGFAINIPYASMPTERGDVFDEKFGNDIELVIKDVRDDLKTRYSKSGKAAYREEQRTELEKRFTDLLGPEMGKAIPAALVQVAFDVLSPEKRRGH